MKDSLTLLSLSNYMGIKIFVLRTWDQNTLKKILNVYTVHTCGGVVCVYVSVYIHTHINMFVDMSNSIYLVTIPYYQNAYLHE